MHVSTFKKLLNNFNYFNKATIFSKRDSSSSLLITDSVTPEGYVEISLRNASSKTASQSNTKDSIRKNVKNKTRSQYLKHQRRNAKAKKTQVYIENPEEVDVPISDFINFRNTLNKKNNSSRMTTSKNIGIPPVDESTNKGTMVKKLNNNDYLHPPAQQIFSAGSYMPNILDTIKYTEPTSIIIGSASYCNSYPSVDQEVDDAIMFDYKGDGAARYLTRKNGAKKKGRKFQTRACAR